MPFWRNLFGNDSLIAWKPVFIFYHQVKQQLDMINVKTIVFLAT